MKTRIFGFISASIGIASVIACSSSSSGSGSTADACASYGNAIVAYQAKCSGSLDPAQNSAVVSRYTTLCQSELTLPGVAPNVGSVLSACASAIAAADCNTNTGDLDACNTAVDGTLANGTSCSSSVQCQSGDCNITATGGSGDGGTATSLNCGTCAPALADGADCTGTGNCVTGDTCEFNSSADGGFSATCVAKPKPGALGAACDSSKTCAAPNHCAFGASSETGTCAAPVASGAACEQSSDCASGLVCAGTATRVCAAPLAAGATCTGGDCAVGFGCDQTSNKCAKYTFGAPGASCDGVVSLCSKGTCNVAASGGGTGTGGAGATGTCPTIIADNGACVSSNSAAQCDEFASCTNGICVFIPATCK